MLRIYSLFACRPNLFLSVTVKSGDVGKDLRAMMLKGVRNAFEGSTIIYCPTKKSAENVENVARCECMFYYREMKILSTSLSVFFICKVFSVFVSIYSLLFSIICGINY